MNHDTYSDVHIRDILSSVKTIAIVGASANIVRPSYFVLQYLIAKGFEVYPVNPGHAGKTILGRPVYGKLEDVPVALDMVDIFRSSEMAGPVTDMALTLQPLPKVIWMQLSVRNDAAAERAEAMGVEVIMDRCPKIEYGRLSGEISWNGVNSRTISARKPQLRHGFQHLQLVPEKK
ncbi:MAG: CoA-binding protein [Stappiaceae bacterium]